MAFYKSKEMYSKIEKRGAYNQTRQMLDNMYNEKYKKSITPLLGISLKKWSDVPTDSLLYTRCMFLKQLCTKLLKDDFILYLFGSQLSGHSSSGQPDIDIWCKTGYFTNEIKMEILNACDFKLDFNFISMEPHYGLVIN